MLLKIPMTRTRAQKYEHKRRFVIENRIRVWLFITIDMFTTIRVYYDFIVGLICILFL